MHKPHDNHTTGLSSCLLIMDDNHFLVEWLAYHYHSMPLRRLIVAVDPKSKTSPSEILDRYASRELMHITIWSDTHYLPSYLDPDMDPVKLYHFRQDCFISSCLKTLKQENRTWTMVINVTLRYQSPKGIKSKPIPGKTLVDLSQISLNELSCANANAHRSVKSVCPEMCAFIRTQLSPLVVYQYAGTLPQFTFRQDGRNSRTATEYSRRQYQSWTDDSASYWSKYFVAQVGTALATQLLEGAGQVERWNGLVVESKNETPRELS